ncbi:hypothetical protein [Legionella fallonii]|uniref:Uncharacterized protein n=1 Tax=Legionella fallonii LLAP-10 TaxID=1212491 RepID=A0A098GAF0_9GAMM|nr:hypothetical protein [Legionella fallonii]CEG58460.1 conserved exported protein of unknown function [Legionella fallonii LLAP-10]
MNYLTGCCVSLLVVANSFATPATSPLPANLIKVTNQNNPKCIEYVTYKGDMYCSLVVIDKTPVDPKILSFEKQIIVFDHRPWKAVWGKNTQELSTVEYLPVGDNIDDWKELVTSQFIPGLTTITPAQFGEHFIADLKKSGVNFTVNTLVNQPDLFIFEFKVDKPSNLQQDEIQKVVKGKNGMYLLHYVIKQANMSDDNRNKWLENLKKSTVKQQ